MIATARGRMAIRTHRVSPHDACPASPLSGGGEGTSIAVFSLLLAINYDTDKSCL
jgi:hypothetical protein